jgi:hypothetical protein
MVVGIMMAAQPDVIQWTAPASCPNDATVEQRILAFVDVETEASPMIATVVEIEGGFEVELVSTIDGETQRRTLQAATCETLADAVAAVVAVTIDPSTATTTTTTTTTAVEPTATPEPPPTRPTVTRGVADAPPVAEPPARKPFEIGLRVGGGWGSAIAPSGSGIVGLAVSFGRKPWSLEAEGRLWIPRTFEASGEDYGARVTLGTAALAFCARPPTRVVEVPLCGGVEAGAMRAAPRGLEEASVAVYPWAAPFLRVGLRLRLRDAVGLLLQVEGAVPTVLASIDITGDDSLRTTQRVSARVLAGLDFRWIR